MIEKACANNYKMDQYSKNYVDHIDKCLYGISTICYALKYTTLNDENSILIPDAFNLIYDYTSHIATELEEHLEHAKVIE